MKKTLLSLGAAALVLSFAASCKKDYTCTCKYTKSGKDTAEVKVYSDTKRQDAHDDCDARETDLKKTYSNTECEVAD